MLSLRDTGKIQENNASIIHLGELCGLIPPFSLKDFILKDCLIDTKIFRIGVALIIWSPANPNLPQAPDPQHDDKSWYENFLLNWRNEKGVANFWYKQSFGKLKIEGQVLPWTRFQIDEAAIFTAKSGDGRPMILRTVAQNIVMQRFQGNFDAFIGVFCLPPDHAIDGGTTGNYSSFGIGDSFDFHTHEVGHLIGGKFQFHHSFGIETADLCTGEYGHPYCVMSAEVYGTNGVQRLNDSIAFPDAEENFRGPGLSGATRSALGWANENQFDLGINEELSFTLQSLGSSYPGFQVIRITDGDKIFCVEYRSSLDDNDRGISNLDYDAELKCDAVVVVNILAGGIATSLAPNSATYLGQIQLNFSTGVVPDTIVNFNPFWGVKIIDFDDRKSTVQIRIIKNNFFSLRIYRRTHNFTLSDGTNTFDIVPAGKVALECNDYMNLSKWRINGQPLKNLRSLVNL
jgi:hypothetical protein